MATHVSHAGLPYPVKNARYTLPIPWLDADGDPTDATSPDSERSIDGGSYDDCAEEATVITGSNGSGFLTLTGEETNSSLTMVACKGTGPKTTLISVQPRVLPIYESGTAQAGASGSITLASGASSVNGFYTGCIVRTTGGTGGGGSGGANNQARVITGYTGSTRVATVDPAWETTPSNDTTYDILLTDLAVRAMTANVTQVAGTAQTAKDVGLIALDASGNVYALTDQGKRVAAQVDVSGVGVVEEYFAVEHADSKVTTGDTTGAFSAADIAKLSTIDGNTLTIGETGAGDGIDAQLRFSGMEPFDVPSEVHVVGRYQGGASHWVAVQAWDYRNAAWVFLHVNNSANGMAHSTTEQSYRFPLSQANFDTVNGVSLIRFLHQGTTPSNGHTGLVLNKVACEFRFTQPDIQDAVYAYNADGTLNTITLASGTVLTYTYSNGRRTGVTVS